MPTVVASHPTVTIGSVDSDRLKILSVTFTLNSTPSSAMIEYLPAAIATSDARRVRPLAFSAVGDINLGDSVTVSDGGIRFTGTVVDVEWDGERILVTAEDARFLLSKMPLHGKMAYLPYVGSGSVAGSRWIAQELTTFNEAGEPDMSGPGNDTGPNTFFIEAGVAWSDANWETDAKEQDGLGPSGGSVFWTPLDILRYLHVAYNSNVSLKFGGVPASVLGTWVDLMLWVAPTDTTLKVGADGNRIVIKDLALTGLGLPDAITAVLSRVVRYNWFLDHSTTPPTFVMRDADLETGISVDALEPGASIEDQVDFSIGLATSWGLRKSSRNRFRRVYAIGARQVYVCTLFMGDNQNLLGLENYDSLVKGWQSNKESGWRDRHAESGDFRENDAADRKYQYVYRRYFIRGKMNWSLYFGSQQYYKLSRQQLTYLFYGDVGQLEGGAVDDQRVRREILVQRRVYIEDPDDPDFELPVWQTLPVGVGVNILPDVGGFLFTANARESSFEAQVGEGLTGGAFTWNADDSLSNNNPNFGDPFPLRMTCMVEADERLQASAGVIPAGESVSKKLIQAPEYKFFGVTRAFVPFDDGTAIETVNRSFPLALRSDLFRLTALCSRKIDQLDVSAFSGSIELTVIDWDFSVQLGLRVTQLGTNDLATGDTPEYPILTQVQYDFEAQSTILTLER